MPELLDILLLKNRSFEIVTLKMISQESIVGIFLSQPSEQLLEKITDKRSALGMLRKQGRTVEKCYFLWTRGEISERTMLRVALENGRKDIFHQIVNANLSNKSKINYGFIKKAARYGDEDDLNFLISIGCNSWRYIARNAAEFGKREVLSDMLRTRKDVDGKTINGVTNFKDIAIKAAYGGHEDIVLAMMKNEIKDRYLCQIASAAAHGGLKKIVINLINKTDYDGNWIVGPEIYCDIACSAARGGHKDIVLSMLELGVKDYDSIVHNANRGGHKELASDIRRVMTKKA